MPKRLAWFVFDRVLGIRVGVNLVSVINGDGHARALVREYVRETCGDTCPRMTFGRKGRHVQFALKVQRVAAAAGILRNAHPTLRLEHYVTAVRASAGEDAMTVMREIVQRRDERFETLRKAIAEDRYATDPSMVATRRAAANATKTLKRARVPAGERAELLDTAAKRKVRADDLADYVERLRQRRAQ